MTQRKQDHDASRRDFVKKATYAAPAVLTLQAFSSSAKAGSGKTDESGAGGQPQPLPGKKKKKKTGR